MTSFKHLAFAFVLASLAISPNLLAENLLTNPGFEASLAGWTVDAYPGLTVRWDPRDSLQDIASGSVLLAFDSVERTTSLGRVYQSIPVTAGAEYAFGAKIRQASNPAGATAFVAMFWLAADGRELYQGDTAVVTADGAWVVTSGRAIAPADAASVQVRLYIREVRGTVVSFDEVFVERIVDPSCPVLCDSLVDPGAPIGRPVTFSAPLDTGCESSPETLWDFGDGSTSNAPDAMHAYGSGGVYRWTLSRVSGDQSCTRTGTIVITNLPLISFFTATPSTVQRGEPVILSWSTSGVLTVSIDGVSGTLPASGTVTVRPSSSARFVLRATNVAGTQVAEVLVQVSESRRRAVRR